MRTPPRRSWKSSPATRMSSTTVTGTTRPGSSRPTCRSAGNPMPSTVSPALVTGWERRRPPTGTTRRTSSSTRGPTAAYGPGASSSSCARTARSAAATTRTPSRKRPMGGGSSSGTSAAGIGSIRTLPAGLPGAGSPSPAGSTARLATDSPPRRNRWQLAQAARLPVRSGIADRAVIRPRRRRHPLEEPMTTLANPEKRLPQTPRPKARLGFNTRVSFSEHTGGPARGLRDGVELFKAAEKLGYQSGWAYQRHFDQYLSSPIPFFAAVGQHTDRITLAWQLSGAVRPRRMRLVFQAGEEALRRVLDPDLVAGGEQVEQQPADRGDHQRGRARRGRRVGVGALSLARGVHPVGNDALEDPLELLRRLESAPVDREEQPELRPLLRVRGPR